MRYSSSNQYYYKARYFKGKSHHYAYQNSHNNYVNHYHKGSGGKQKQEQQVLGEDYETKTYKNFFKHNKLYCSSFKSIPETMRGKGKGGKQEAGGGKGTLMSFVQKEPAS